MGVAFSMSNNVKVSANELFSRMSSPAWQEKAARHFGALEVTTKILSETDDSVKVELYQEEPGKKGGIDKSTLVFEWNKKNMSCTWTRKDHTNGDMVKVKGSVTILPAGDTASTLKEDGEVDIAVPLIGKKIAGKIASAMERKHADKCRFWESE